MSANSFPYHGLVAASDDETLDNMGDLAHTIVGDIMYNIIHDIVLKTHREEKMARAASAAILVEQTAAQTDPSSSDHATASESSNLYVETDAAIYDNGTVTVKGNPLKTVSEIRCPKCGLPRLLHPTDGNGARKPDPGVEYCKKKPYIEKDYHDIYGQTFQPDGPGRGKKKKDMVDPLKLQQQKSGGTPSGSQDSPGGSPPPGDGPAKPIAFPHAKCHNCNTFLPIKRMNNHMVKCIGGGGRDSSRTALWKIQNGSSGNGSQNGNTPPPSSRNSTPVPSNNSTTKSRSSPSKRDREGGDDGDSDSSPQKKPKKNLFKKTAAAKLKAPKMTKNGSQQREASNLSFEEKPPGNSDSEDDEGDDDGDGTGEYGSVTIDPKKKNFKPSGVKKIVKEKKKWRLGKGGSRASLPQVELPDSRHMSGKNSAGMKVKPENGASITSVASINGKHDEGAESESSQTLSSPN